jgi:hypothetical protein
VTGVQTCALPISIGAKAVSRAAGRTLSRPGFWIAVAVLAFLVYWFFLRR